MSNNVTDYLNILKDKTKTQKEHIEAIEGIADLYEGGGRRCD
ncbi:MAG: hypothetical protein WCJ33_02590 [Pseudomonadota bacterium]